HSPEDWEKWLKTDETGMPVPVIVPAMSAVGGTGGSSEPNTVPIPSNSMAERVFFDEKFAELRGRVGARSEGRSSSWHEDGSNGASPVLGFDGMQPDGVDTGREGRATNPSGVLLGQLLVEQGLLTQPELQEALAEQQRTGRRLGEVVVRLGFVDERRLTN